MTDKELVQWAVAYRQKSYSYVGELINSFSAIEFQIEHYLISYFFTSYHNKGHDMKSFIIDRLTFEAKRTAFKAMIDEYSTKTGFVKTNSNSWPHSKLLEEIRKLQNERNYFAHYPSIVPHEPNETIVTLIEQRDGTKLLEYDYLKFKSIVDRMTKAAVDVGDIWYKHLGGAK